MRNICSIIFYQNRFMSNKGGLLILGGLGVAAVVLYTKANAAQKLIVEGTSVRFLELNQGAIAFDTILTIINPTNSDISLNGIGGEIYLNDQSIGSAFSETPVVIKGYSTTRVFIPTRIGFLNAIYIGQSIWNTIKGAGLSVSFKGAARAFGFNVPIDTTISLKV